MSFFDSVNNGLSRIGTRLGNIIFTWKGEDFECIPSTSADTRNLKDDGGFSVDSDLSLTVREDQFSDGILPSEQEKLTYRGDLYRIQTVRKDASGALLRLICVSISRGV